MTQREYNNEAHANEVLSRIKGKHPQSPQAGDELEAIVLKAFDHGYEVSRTVTGLADEKFIAHQEATVEYAAEKVNAYILSEIQKAKPERYTLKTGLLWDSQDATDGYHQALDDYEQALTAKFRGTQK